MEPGFKSLCVESTPRLPQCGVGARCALPSPWCHHQCRRLSLESSPGAWRGVASVPALSRKHGDFLPPGVPFAHLIPEESAGSVSFVLRRAHPSGVATQQEARNRDPTGARPAAQTRPLRLRWWEAGPDHLNQGPRCLSLRQQCGHVFTRLEKGPSEETGALA